MRPTSSPSPAVTPTPASRAAALTLFSVPFAILAITAIALRPTADARAWSVGLNWYLNRNIRVNASYSHTSFTGGHGPTATVTAYPENVLFTRIQLSF